MPFTPILRETAADACTRSLRAAVLSGELGPGAHLPPERVLAVRLGVNRVTLRTAIARVAAQGLLVARQGSGTRVVDYRRGGGPELLGDLAVLADPTRRERIVTDLLAARRGLARALLERLAAVRPDPAPVRAAIDTFGQAVTDGADPDTLARADLAVTAALVDAADSPVFALCLNPVAAALDALPALRGALYRAPATNLAGWEALAAWLGDPDPALIPVILDAAAARDAVTVAALEGR
jgi:GntR family transcriptional repressor for pyruvate dehydrogenase complex